MDGKAINVTQNQSGENVTIQHLRKGCPTCQEFVVTTPNFSTKRWILWTLVLNMIGYAFKLHLQDSYVMTYLIVCLLIVLALKLHFKVVKESLLVTGTIGVQLTTFYASGRKTSKFYDVASIKDVTIIEAISMYKVVTYMAIILKGESPKDKRLIPLFMNSLPKLYSLKILRKNVLDILYGKRKKGSSVAP